MFHLHTEKETHGLGDFLEASISATSEPVFTTQSSSRTRINVFKSSHKWTIENFSYCPQKPGEALDSGKFYGGTNRELEWCLMLYPKGDSEKVKDYISVFLKLVSCRYNYRGIVFAKFKFSLFDSNMVELQAKCYENCFVQRCNLGWKEFLRRDSLLKKNGELPGDELTIFCEVSAAADIVNKPNPKVFSSVNASDSQSQVKFTTLYETKRFSDVVLNAKGTEFRAHKAILSTNSPVFAAMFEHEMEEQVLNRVEIPDFDGEVIDGMLRFMYINELPTLGSKLAQDLLEVADKYAFERLKVACEDFLLANLTKDSVADILVLADMHNALRLKKHSLKFIRSHAPEVLESCGWTALVQSNQQLVNEVIKSFYEASETSSEFH